jgi:coenzyme F420-dependent glucose-6-phosphate dehydrogenase
VLPLLGERVARKPFGTSVTPVVHHYHPGVIAQFWMGLEELFPGRAYLGVGSGEALNEVPLGCDPWVSPEEKLDRFATGLEAITRLWEGQTVTMDAGWFKLKEAKLYTRAKGRPKLYVSAFGPKAAAIAGRYGDGLWTLGDPDGAPEVIDAYREACAQHGREPGEIIVQSGFHLAEDAEAVLADARKWKATQLDDAYLRDLHDPAEMEARAHAEMTDDEFAQEGFLLTSDPEEHASRIREMVGLGATVVCLQGIGSHDPLGSIRRYGEEVLPAVRQGARA